MRSCDSLLKAALYPFTPSTVPQHPSGCSAATRLGYFAASLVCAASVAACGSEEEATPGDSSTGGAGNGGVTAEAGGSTSGGTANGGGGGVSTSGGASNGGTSATGGGASSGGTSSGGAGSGGASNGGAAGTGGDGTVTPPGGGNYMGSDTPDFGPNVLIFDPSMGDATIQSKIDEVFGRQQTSQFGSGRYAYFFKPGKYALDVQIGFYMEVLGLGNAPDDVTITGAVRGMAKWNQGNATVNFWRYAANLAVTPTSSINSHDVWATSQGTGLRRIHVTSGGMNLFDPEGGPNEWASGGFIADSKIDGTVVPGSQQQYLTRNVTMQSWTGGVWNMVFVENQGNPNGTWPASPYTFVDDAPSFREKPYLTIDGAGKYSVVAPTMRANTNGTSWASGNAPSVTIPLSQFYVARSGMDSADSINTALAAGANLILTPGTYHLASAIDVTRPGTVVLGLGLATLTPDNGTPAITVADVDSVTIGGILFEAGATESPALLQLGDAVTGTRHSASPTALFDVMCRVGGAAAGSTTSCVVVNSNDVIIDNSWLWRADHGTGVGWDVNRAKHGIVVNGAGVTAYGLFVEHFQEYQTLWNGNDGRVYFYQSEIPYDVPSQDRWTHDGDNGWSSFKVADGVSTFDARGLGIYAYFNNPVVLENAIESPTSSGVRFQHIVTQWFKNATGSAVNHIINGTGDAVNATNTGATTPN